MRIAFVHQNIPGQFVHLLGRLARDGGHALICIGRRTDFAMQGVGRVLYDLPDTAIPRNPFVTPFETAVRHGVQVARACEALARNGQRPDLIVAHPGWGESLFVKDVFPDVPLLHYCEWYYNAHGADVNFLPGERQDLMADCATRTRNVHLAMALAGGDWGYSPTAWQRQQHPAAFRASISVAFDGIDTEAAKPDKAATFALPDGRVLRVGDEVVTYVARGLEPYRGYPNFVRALPSILRRRPDAQVVIVGGDTAVYGAPPPDGGTWRAAMEAEVPLDPARVHVIGFLPRAEYLRLLQVSAVHVYLTVPFVLSWSMLEAMAAGCLVVGSATPPVQEAIEDGQNGLLVDFHNPAAIADRVVDGLAHMAKFQPLRQAARWTALSRYSLERCLPRQQQVLEAVVRREAPA